MPPSPAMPPWDRREVLYGSTWRSSELGVRGEDALASAKCPGEDKAWETQAL